MLLNDGGRDLGQYIRQDTRREVDDSQFLDALVYALGAFEADQARADEVELAVQICGKIKGRVTVAADAPEPEVLAAAREAVAAALEGKTVKKEVYVPGRLVNIVAV